MRILKTIGHIFNIIIPLIIFLMENCLVFNHLGISKRIYSLIILINFATNDTMLLIVNCICIYILIDTILRVNLFFNTFIILRTRLLRTLIDLLIKFLIRSFI